MGIAAYIAQKLIELAIKINPLDEHPHITFAELAIKTGTCCICGGKLRKSQVKEGHFALIYLYKKATWLEPVATLGTRDGSSYSNFAVAIICNNCDKPDAETIRASVNFAIELDRSKKELIYHNVKTLEDYPLIIER